MLTDDGLEILTEDECSALLARSEVGRVGFTVGALPAIFPVAFTVMDGCIYFRTGEGIKLTHVRGAVVSFEVDDYDCITRSGWSVLVVGVAREVADERTDARLVGRLRTWAEGARHHVIRLEPTMISGRRLLSF